MLMHMDISIKSDTASTMDRKVIVEHLKEKEGVKE
jgi:ribose 5-phosphate isomerase RpiB